jgi:catechol 2,3-dioxygenase-like lactoylglutathione lyase family enzyme
MKTLMIAGAALLMAGAAVAQNRTVTTPEGALMEANADLAYKPGQLSQEQLMSSTRSLFVQNSANVFRRFPREATEQMVKFYTGALALRSLNPIQLTTSQQMLLTGVGSGQIKLSAGQQGNRKYLAGSYRAATGIRFFALTYPDQAVVMKRFTDAGFAAPTFVEQGNGTKAALVTDPGGFQIQVVIRPGAKDGSNDGVGVGINVSDLAKSRAFYREFVGLDELPAIQDKLLGVTLYPYRHKETTIYLYKSGDGLPQDNGSAGIQYVVSDAPMADAKGKARKVAVETPLNKLRGFDLTTVWLNDPDGVTNYYAQVAARRTTAAAN